VGVYERTDGDSLDELDDPLTVDDIVRIRNDVQYVELGALTTERKSPKTDEKATTTGKPSQSQEPYHVTMFPYVDKWTRAHVIG
jgi:hypothetical protein